jgi:hypothetical protein
MKKLEPAKKKQPTERDLLLRRACVAWQRAGFPQHMIAGEESDVTDAELRQLADLVDDKGQPVENFRELMRQAWEEFHDTRKATAEDPAETGFGLPATAADLVPAPIEPETTEE